MIRKQSPLWSRALVNCFKFDIGLGKREIFFIRFNVPTVPMTPGTRLLYVTRLVTQQKIYYFQIRKKYPFMYIIRT